MVCLETVDLDHVLLDQLLLWHDRGGTGEGGWSEKCVDTLNHDYDNKNMMSETDLGGDNSLGGPPRCDVTRCCKWG